MKKDATEHNEHDESSDDGLRFKGQSTPSDGTYDVREFGARGDGVSLDTAAINRAVDLCSLSGGGKVLVPPGVYLSGTIHLRSNVLFHIEAGATILGSTSLADYQGVQDEERGREWFSALMIGDSVSNVEVSGQGEINGNNVSNPQGEEEMRGPHAIMFYKSDNITIRDISVKDAGNYAHLLQECKNGSLRGVRVSGGWDGVDLFECKNFLITDCQFATGDDCVAGGGWENVVVSNCTLNSNCNGMRNYRGGLKDVVFSNIIITGPSQFRHRTHDTPSKSEFLVNHNAWHRDHDSLSGFWLAGGGSIDNLIITNVVIRGLRCPIWLSSQGMYTAEGQHGYVRNVHICNLTATDVGKPRVASLIQGSVERPIENIVLSNITIRSVSEGTKEMVDDAVPERAGDPIELQNCSGMYCRHISDLEMHNVRFGKLETDVRPVLICDKIDHLHMYSVRCLSDPRSETVLLRDIKELERHPMTVG